MPGLRVLVVDDNPLIRRLLDLLLEEDGHVPIDADSGESALAVALADPPDLVIVDEVMPGMRGSELIRALRAAHPRLAAVPVIGMSGHPDGARVLLAAGATAFVSKPVQDAPLRAAIAVAAARAALGEASAHSP